MGKEQDETVSVAIRRIGSRSFLEIGTSSIGIADYSIKSSADGYTELSVIIKGESTIFDSLTNLALRM